MTEKQTKTATTVSAVPIAAQCPNCGGPLSETSVLALAPVCKRCGTVMTKVGGTLGLTSAYGVNDSTITRKRVEADLAVFREYRNNYIGMLEACKEQLNWGVERYAALPNPPEFLSLVSVPTNFWSDLFGGLMRGVRLSVYILVGTFIAVIPCAFIADFTASPGQRGHSPPWLNIPFLLMIYLTFIAWIFPLAASVLPHYKAKIANGERPVENARREREYEAARAAAMKAAEPIKAAQDHRLRSQIRELDGLIETVTEKAEDVRRILRTL